MTHKNLSSVAARTVPASYIDRYYDESRVYIRWGCVLTLLPLLGFIPFAYLQLDKKIAAPLVASHIFLAACISLLIYFTYRIKSGQIANAVALICFLIGGTGFNFAGYFNSDPPVIYVTVAQLEVILLLFIALRVPWWMSLAFGALVVSVFVYIVTMVWPIDPVDAITIAVATIFILFIVSMGAYSRDKQTFKLYRAQDSMKELQEERVRWSKTFTQFLKHELGNQIAAISMSFHALSLQDSNQDNAYVSQGESSVEEVRELVQRAADAVHIDELVENIRFVSVDILGLLDDLIDDYQGMAMEGRAIEVRNLFHDEKHVIQGDYLLLKQMFRNIIDNALRYSNPESTVRVDIFRSGDIEIIDEGEKLPDDIEGLFVLGGEGGSGKAGLYGLGLYLARKIAIAHGGSLNGHHLEDAQGAVFSICLSDSPGTD